MLLCNGSSSACAQYNRLTSGLSRLAGPPAVRARSLLSSSQQHKQHHHPQASGKVNQAVASASTMYTYKAPIVQEPSKPASAAVIMLHGLGDQGYGWASIAQEFAATLPHVRFVFPNAPERPITLNMGFRMPGWYDIYSLDKISAKEDEDGILESARYLDTLVKEQGQKGIPPERLVVAGFSQGGAMALYTLRSDSKFAGVAGLSTYLLMHEREPLLSAANKDTPVFMAHGDSDQVVNYKYGSDSYERLKKAGAKIEFKSYHGMGHSACPQELQDFQRFLAEVLPAK